MSTYERNRKVYRLNRRFIIFIVVMMLISAAAGSAVTYAVTGHISLSDKVSDEGQENVPTGAEPSPEGTQESTAAVRPSPDDVEVFGAYDDRIFTHEISMDWEATDPEFTALPVNLDPDIQQFIWWLCKGYNLDFSFVMAMIWQESTFRSDVISGTNDYGLMQINKINHEWLTQTIGVTDFLDPYQNIRAGTFILRKLFEKYKDPSMVLMAYNMGEGGAGRLWKQGIYSTSYSESVLAYQRQIIAMMEGGE